jgi:hypothetical protein
MTVSAIVWLWKNFPFGLALLAILIFLVVRAIYSERWRRKRLGYWVKHLSPGQLRAGEDDFALVYREEKREHFFCGKVGQPRTPDILIVPSETTWESQVPTSMSGERDMILKRLQQEFSRMQFVETDAE